MALGARWFTIAILAATAVGPICSAPAQPVNGDASAELALRDVQRLSETIYRSDATREQRDEAARRLVQRGTPQSRQAIHNILRDFGSSQAQLAVTRALAENPTGEASLIDPLFALIGDREITAAAARALAGYRQNPDVLTRLINIAQARQQPEWMRVPVIRAIGIPVERRAAEFLIRTLNNADESPAVRNAAADALANMTGQVDIGLDPQRWNEWWAANQLRSDSEFRSTLLAARAAALDQLKQRHQSVVEATERLLAEQYRRAQEEQRRQVLLGYLRDPEPEVRAIAARLVYEDKLSGLTPAAGVLEQLRQLVGDSSTRVRREVARTLGAVNDPAALEPLLAQLAQENNASVREVIALAMGGIRDLRAVPVLLRLLNDPSHAVAKSAADALRELGPLLQEDDPPLASRAAQQLRATYERHAMAPATADLRDSVVEAMATLAQPELAQSFNQLLNHPSLRIRRAALRGLGAIGDADRADIDMIIRMTADPQPAVRLEAVNALQTMARVEHAEHLRRRVDPLEEPDRAVRDAAWKIFTSLMPQMSVEQLQAFADRFMAQKDAERRLTVLLQLRDVLQRDARQPELLALTQENIGQVLMMLNRPQEAAAYFRSALDSRPERVSVVKERLARALAEALLQAKDYPQAARFASEMIAQDVEYQGLMGPTLKSEVDRLVNRADNPQDALVLIAETRKMNPALAERFQAQLEMLEQDARRKLAENRPVPPGEPAGPRSAVGPASTSVDTGSVVER